MAWDRSTAIKREMGDAGPWVRHTREAWQAAASDVPARRLPPDPTNAYLKHLRVPDAAPLSAPHARLLAYWNPLLHLLLYGLGWIRADVGLLRWRERGFPTSDRVLGVVARWWGTERLEDFAAWAITCDHIFENMANDIRGASHVPQSPVARPHTSPALEQHREQPSWRRIWSEGSDEMHLRGHAMAPVGTDGFDMEPSVPRFLKDGDGHAVLITRTYSNWYRWLANPGDLGIGFGFGAQETVDVICSPVGWLGTYRQSPHTGLWHRTDEQTHMLGN